MSNPETLHSYALISWSLAALSLGIAVLSFLQLFAAQAGLPAFGVGGLCAAAAGSLQHRKHHIAERATLVREGISRRFRVV